MGKMNIRIMSQSSYMSSHVTPYLMMCGLTLTLTYTSSGNTYKLILLFNELIPILIVCALFSNNLYRNI